MKKILSTFLMLWAVSTTFSQSPQWHYLPNNGLSNGTYRIEDVFFTNYATGFAVTLNGKIYKTTNGGLNWEPKYNDPDIGFRSIEFLDDGLTGIAGSFYSDTGKVFKTDDGGETWADVSASIIAIGSKEKTICGIAHYNNNFYAVGWWGAKQAMFFKSTDKGGTWQTMVIDTNLATNLVDVLFLNENVGYATGGRNTTNQLYSSNHSVVLKTIDGGQTWTKVFSDSVIGGRIWKIQAINAQILVGSVEPYYTDTAAMIKSTDGGNTWNMVGTGFSVTPTSSTGTIGTQGIGFISPQKGWIGGYYNGLFETTDGGNTWDTLDFGADFNRFFVMDSSHVYAGGASVYRYGDSANFTIHVPYVKSKPPHILYPISPNPAKGRIKIEFDLLTETDIILEVANIESKHVFSINNKRLKPGHYVYCWDGTGQPVGHYFIWLGTNEIPIVQKFVLIN